MYVYVVYVAALHLICDQDFLSEKVAGHYSNGIWPLMCISLNIVECIVLLLNIAEQAA